jgi:predicted lipoprotein with Yx(FWY)xxD motif
MSRRSTIGLAALLVAAGLAAVAIVVLVATRGARPGRGRSAERREPARDASVQTAPDNPLRVARTRRGRILVDGRGRTLYLFTRDRHGRSTCTGKCTRVWPPALVSGRPTAGPGVASSMLRSRRRADGASQLVYNGHPLYTLTADTQPGQAAGQGFEGTWYVVSPAGRPLGRRGDAAGGY